LRVLTNNYFSDGDLFQYNFGTLAQYMPNWAGKCHWQVDKLEVKTIVFAQSLSCYLAMDYNKSNVFSGMLAEI